MAAQQPRDHNASVALRAREQLIADADAILAPLVQEIGARLNELESASTNAREMQDRRDAVMQYARLGPAWQAGVSKAWKAALTPPTATAQVRMEAADLSLIGDEVVERKIMASRIALPVMEKATWELNDLKIRMQHLEGQEPMPMDVLRPDALCQIVVDQWDASGLSREIWAMVSDLVSASFINHLPGAYRRVNEFLISQNVLREIVLAARVKRSPAAPAARAAEAPPDDDAAGKGRAAGGHGGGRGGRGGRAGRGGGEGDGAEGGPSSGPDGPTDGGSDYAPSGPGMTGVGRTGVGGVGDETRMMTTASPLARARQRASGVLGQLRRMLGDKVAGFDSSRMERPSPGLAEAIAQQATQIGTRAQGMGGGTIQETMVYDDAGVQQIARDLRQRTGELKRKAATSSEKATIEIVALMFQSILAEERIPPSIRVWFARLQMPVLRVALSEPDFFDSLQHPARLLIDRMGSCVMGFDAGAISGSALETEIRRIVQVIEQYPDTGRRVFQLVYDEFEKFLAKYLTEKGNTQRLVTVAQQVEQKETMAVQYTIELRKLLDGVPVRDDIREFMFKVWAEVLAVAAVRYGPQHEDTVALKKAAADLVWAASAKPNRNDRARVIQDLPRLLQRLRQGMGIVGIEGSAQEAHIKVIGDTLADAFMSKTEAIPHTRIEEMARRLANLEDFITETPGMELALDPDTIEMMLGIDASSIEVVSGGGSRPSAAMLAWAQELQLGHWFSLDHNGKTTQVQYVWRSDKKHLHLFASAAGRSFLIQARRMAAYLQAGLLVPSEDEALTVRATRAALAKLDANPERLLTVQS